MDGMISSWNPGAEEIVRLHCAEVMASRCAAAPPDRAAEGKRHFWSACAKAGVSPTLKTVRVRKDGLHIDVSVTISPIRDRAGSIVGASKIARDITERKRVLVALRQSEERFQPSPTASSTCWMAEADGPSFWFNQRWYDYTGTTLDSQGLVVRNVHDPNFLPRYWSVGRRD